MAGGRQRFILKATTILIVAIVLLTLIGVSVDATIARFGNLGWIHWLLGFFTLIAGVIVTWACTISFLDWRALGLYRVEPGQPLNDGQTVALCGQVRVDGQPLTSPFSDKPCACYSYQVSGQRRGTGSSTNSYRQYLCLLGYHILPSVLDCGSRQFALMAIPDVDTDFRSTAMGGDWGERGLEHIRTGADNWPHAEEADARGALSDAQANIRAPQAVDLFVAPTQTSANQINVQEDILPVDTTVTLLATYVAGIDGLNGRRFGGMKAFLGNIDERLLELKKEWRKCLKIAPPLLIIGFALLCLAWWLPA